MLLASEDIKQKQNETEQNERTNGSVPFPPESMQRQLVCLLLRPVFIVHLRGEPVNNVCL